MTMPDDPALQTLRAAFDEESAPSSGDDAMLTRAVQGALASLAVGAMASTAAGVAAKGANSVVARASITKMVLPFAAGVVASVVGGAMYLSLRAAPAPPPPAAAVVVPIAAPAVVPVSAPAEEPRGISVDELPMMPASRIEAAPLAPAATETAPELFRAANAARRAGDVEQAVAGYRALGARFPDAGETRAARVSLGMLLLDKQGNPAGALREFDTYLAGGARDTLAEEARLGRALALQRLGRDEEERRAWQTLIENHPQSLHLTRARARLAALGASAP